MFTVIISLEKGKVQFKNGSVQIAMSSKICFARVYLYNPSKT